MLGTFPKAKTFQGYFPSARPLSSSSHSAGPHCSLRRLRRPNLTFGKLHLEKLHICEIATWEIFVWEAAFGKIPNTEPDVCKPTTVNLSVLKYILFTKYLKPKP